MSILSMLRASAPQAYLSDDLARLASAVTARHHAYQPASAHLAERLGAATPGWHADGARLAQVRAEAPAIDHALRASLTEQGLRNVRTGTDGWTTASAGINWSGVAAVGVGGVAIAGLGAGVLTLRNAIRSDR